MKPNAAGNKGFTLMELLITMSLFSMIIVGIYMLFSLVQRNYNTTDTRSAINQQMNLAYMQMDTDIRSASKPNRNTYSIKVGDLSEEDTEESAQDLHIYTYNETLNKFIRIQYRIHEGKLWRGYVECGSEKPPVDTLNPSYGDILQWEELVGGLIEDDGEIHTGFTDNTQPGTNERRTIEITFIANALIRPLNRPVITTRIFTSRSIVYPK